MGTIILVLLVLLFWFFLLRRAYRKIGTASRRTKLEPNYDLEDPCPKRRGEAALCAYCPLFDSNTGECDRGRWRQ